MLIKLLVFVFFTLIFTLFNFSYSQKENQRFQKKVDSISYLLQSKTYDTTRVNRLNELASIFIEKERYDEAMPLVEESKKLSEKINFSTGKVFSYSYIGDILKNQGKVNEGIVYLENALKVAKNNGNLTQESYVYDQLGLANWTKGDTLESLNNHRKSLQIREKINNTYRQAQSNGNIAIIYSAQGKMKEAIEYYKASLKIYNELNETFQIAWSAGNVGLMNYWLGNTSEALKYFILSLEKYEKSNNNEGVVWISSQISNIYKSIDDFENALKYAEKVHQNHMKTYNKIGIAEAYSLKAGIYFEMNDFQKSKKTHEQSFKIYSSHGDSLGVMNSLYNLGNIYFNLKDFEASLESVQKSLKIGVKLNQIRAIAKSKMLLGAIYTSKGNALEARRMLSEALDFFKKTESISNLPFTYKYLVKVDSMDGDFISAFENHKLYIQHRDEQKITITDTEKVAMRYEFEKTQAIAASELKNQQTQRNAAVFGLILTTLLIIVLIYFFRLRNKKIIVEQEKIDLQKRDIDRIKESEQFKSRFLTNITHEFRTPLTLIKAHLEVLMGNGRKEDQFRFKEMDNNGTRLLQLINQLLDLSKMEVGAYKLSYRSGNILDETVALIQSFQSLSDQKLISLIINKDASEVNKFIYSQEALAIIVSNLLSNSFKFTPEGGTVQVEMIFSDTETFVLKVTDTGKGISATHLPNIFDRFYQIDEPFQRTYEGSGIGLALVKELSLIHGGDVKVVSPETGGCTFTVILKSAISEQVHEAEKQNENVIDISLLTEMETTNHQESELPLILVVEDQTQLRRFIIENLGSEYRYAEAVNGKEGIQLAEQLIPDLIISDVMMPDVNGMEMCQYLKSKMATSHIPIMLLTAKSDEADRLMGLETGANDYLTKPFSLAEIKLRVKNMVQLRIQLHKNFEVLQMSKSEVPVEMNVKDKEFIEKIHQVIVNNLTVSQFGVPELAKDMFLSVSQFNRKLKSITGRTPSEYIRNFKLQTAVEMLKGGMSVFEAGWSIGFEDPVYFSKVFKKHVGYPPSEVKK